MAQAKIQSYPIVHDKDFLSCMQFNSFCLLIGF